MPHMTGAFESQGYGRGTDRLIALSFSLSTLTWGLGRCGEEIVSPPDRPVRLVGGSKANRCC